MSDSTETGAVGTIDVDPRRLRKLILSLLLAILAAALFNAGHAIDAFIPKHLAVGYETAVTGHLPDNGLTAQIPGFYTFVSALFLVLDIDPFTLAHFPIQLVPYVTAYFALIYLVSRGQVAIAGLLAGFQVFISTSATWRAYLWPHGIGMILFITALVALVLLFHRSAPLHVAVILLPCSVALVYMSYNLTAIYLLVTSALLLWYPLRDYVPLDERVWTGGRLAVVFGAWALTSAAVLLSEFFYVKFVPLVQSGIEVAGILRFLATWTGFQTISGGELSHLQTSPPDVIRYLAIARNLVILVGLVGLLAYLLLKFKRDREVTALEALLVAYAAGISMYFFARMLVGRFAIQAFYTPGVLALAFLYSHARNQRVTAAVVILLLVLGGSIVATQVANNRHETIEEDLDVVYHADNELAWLERYDATQGMVRSDELTINSLVYSDVLQQDVPSYSEARSNYRLVSPSQAAALTTGADPNGSECFLLNNRQRTASLAEWQVITAWEQHREAIDGNPYVNKVYTEGPVWYVCN